MGIRDRLGFDAGGMGLDDALAWAARHDFHYIDNPGEGDIDFAVPAPGVL
jgi:hypothetical protein